MYPGSQRGSVPYGRPAGSGGQKPGDPRGGLPSAVPSLSALSGSQQFQWMVQPSAVTHGASGFYQRPYPCPELGGAPGPSEGLRSGVIRAPFGGRRRKEEELSPEEEERRRLRRERNKLAAAKCRNRRRELTDWLQAETDQLEDKKSSLQKEIAELQKEKERLEFVLEAHQPICKIPAADGGVKPGPSRGCGAKVKGRAAKPAGPKPRPADVPIPPASQPAERRDAEALHTPTLITTPFTASLAFTYPSVPPYEAEPSAGPSGSVAGALSSPEDCAAAHRRGSSSGDQSSDSLSSPTLVAL